MAKIIINDISIDPEMQQGEPRFAALMGPDSVTSNYILIQTIGPLDRDQRNELTTLNVEILEYVPENTYICRYEPSNLDVVRVLPFVQWVNIYLEDFKIPSHFRAASTRAATANLLSLGNVETSMSQEPKPVVVVFHKGISVEDIRDEVAAAARLDPTELKFSGNSIRLTVQPQNLEDLAKIDAVRHIEEYLPPKLHNNIALGILRADETHSKAHFEGKGQIVAVCDTGFDRGSISDVHPAFTGRVVKLYALGRPKANDPHGHGTHVAGSVLGDGHSDTMGGAIRGTAPQAKLIVQSVLDHEGGLDGLPEDLNELFTPPYEQDGARIHTNSWGRYRLGRYTVNSEQIDQFVWDHRDFVVCFSAGNESTDRDADGVVNNGSVTPPATAKNCITVGASESNRPEQSKSYGAPWPQDFPVDPIASDMWADAPAGIAAFSGRGPTQNGRIKPDVVTPGTSILSTHSRDARVGSFWGRSSDSLYVFMGGTSMAAPLVAGCAAVVREYFQTVHHHQPSAALVKAMLINGARDIPGQYVSPEAEGIPNPSEGFGRVDLAATVGPYDDNVQIIFKDEDTELDTREMEKLEVEIPASGSPLKATLVWTDPPGEALQNDLDLIVRAANGEERHGNMPSSSTSFDRLNNVEQVVWNDIPVGKVEITVRAHRITLPQSYALVVRTSGDTSVIEDTEIDVNVEILEVDLLQYGLWALMAKVSFLQVSGANAEELIANRTPFRIDISMADMDNGTEEPQLVASGEGQFEPGIVSYSKQLQFAIPGPGHYKLHTYLVILLPSGKEITAEYEGPTFKVIP